MGAWRPYFICITKRLVVPRGEIAGNLLLHLHNKSNCPAPRCSRSRLLCWELGAVRGQPQEWFPSTGCSRAPLPPRLTKATLWGEQQLPASAPAAAAQGPRGSSVQMLSLPGTRPRSQPDARAFPRNTGGGGLILPDEMRSPGYLVTNGDPRFEGGKITAMGMCTCHVVGVLTHMELLFDALLTTGVFCTVQMRKQTQRGSRGGPASHSRVQV